MLRISTFIFVLTCFISCKNASEKDKTSSSEKSTSNISEEEKNEKYPHDFMFMQRAYPDGKLNTAAYSEAIRWKRQVAHRSNANEIWQFSGPLNIGGRISDIEIPTTQPEVYYVGAASGGIFKTINGGNDWTPIFDEQQMLSIGDIEISKTNNNLIYVGTGEVNAGGGSLVYDGDGIYKSTDGGTTWQSKGLPDIGSVGKIVLDPNNDNTAFVGAMGPLFKNSANRGVYKTTNGGDSWQQVLFVSDSTGVVDMAIHPTNGNIIYAASWERIRRPNRRQYGGITSRIYKTTNGGSNWTELTNGLPSIASQKGRISIDISQSNPNVLYTRYADATGNIQGVYKTINGGDSWTAVNSSQLTDVGFHWWFGGIFIDPTDENTIYNVDFEVQKSTNGGTSWGDSFANVHVDQHAMAFNASVPGEVLLGNDGGLYYSSNGGSSSVKDLKLPITQFYRMHVDAQNENKIYGGAQDNSTSRTQTGGLTDWNIINGGDGFQPLVDPTNTNVIYALSQNGFLRKSINNGSSFSNATNGISSGDRNNWDTPITFDASNSQTLYYGTNRLYKTTNAAGNWTAISPDLTDGPHAGNLTFGTITTISVSPLNNEIIFVGTDDGKAWVTQNGGSNWIDISAGIPNRWVTKVLASREDPNTVYLTLSGYRFGEDVGHVYKSTDLGNNWFDISVSLPDIPVNDVEQDSFGNLFIGTDVGVLATADEGINWSVLGENLPSVVVTDLHIHEDSQFLFAATFGRSTYKIDIANDILSTAETIFSSEVKVFPNPASEIVTVSLKNTSENTSLEIYDVMGRFVKQQKFDGQKQLQLSIEKLQPGIYYLKISEGKKQTTKKLIVK
ncbi:VPS10 domain-containing protein [Aequorivita lipolytica]|uniref:T9SS type A sorting domain-containing protein n=1 Tax=Aequorivita lipolytica TaxID=153267 RepID=A0A5C6YRE6_9FLAO|nr:T9SS type A sorting domain-containing protein [Aequorivita lipolytica]TXD69957.1 T9SS type A sorting domain-containing protein [Aequorivita lipolytica]SRX50218.1 Xyloglucanase [Aequorivita lipolytica]